jgi:glycosyltransferase involved in cell wall biosynthesis
MKVALVHEALNVYGGAEKVLEELHATFPDAPVYVPTFDPASFPPIYKAWDVRATNMNKLPLVNRYPRHVFPFYPFAMNTVNLDDYDVIISSTFNFAHNVVTGPQTVHISYCHSPPRFLWDFNRYAEREGFGWAKKKLVQALLPVLRANDQAAALNVDAWISTSRLVQDRILKYYRRKSAIIPPPIRADSFYVESAPENYFLLLMRLVGWKRGDIAVQACSELGLPLVVAGDGRDMARLKSIAGPTVRFVGRVEGEEKAKLYASCAAFILPSVEDFGITPLEAMASGRPVIALGKGGVLDTVVPGRTGEFFEHESAESLKLVLSRFRPDDYDPWVIRAHAEQFDTTHFRSKIKTFVEQRLRASQRMKQRELRPYSAQAAQTMTEESSL